MKIKFFNPKQLDKNLRAAVHKSGKLGFTINAANMMNLNLNKSAAVGINEEDSSDTSLYILLMKEEAENGFKVSKAGNYYYINLKNFFDTLKINYKIQSLYYEISEEQFDKQKIFKLTRNVRKEKIK